MAHPGKASSASAACRPACPWDASQARMLLCRNNLACRENHQATPRLQPPPTFSCASTLLVVEETAEPTLVRAAPVARPTATHKAGRRVAGWLGEGGREGGRESVRATTDAVPTLRSHESQPRVDVAVNCQAIPSPHSGVIPSPKPHPPADSLTAVDAADARSLMRSLWSSSLTCWRGGVVIEGRVLRGGY